ncbi:MAG: diphosphomevalonate decarboxylase [Anaerolineales bacterium]|jgi:diphosphomevalonate decarboxylase
MAPLFTAALASPNIALIKYWGNRNHELRVPSNDSLSFTLAHLQTRTSVSFKQDYERDLLILDGTEAPEAARLRASNVLDRIRELSGRSEYARIESENNFPSGAGIAASSSAFAALALAGTAAAGLAFDSRQLSRLARLGSGSAARSIFGGFAWLHAGRDDATSFAEQIYPRDHWLLTDCIAIVQPGEKKVGSTDGHQLAETSPLQKARIEDTPRRLELARAAIGNRDFDALAAVSEQDSNMMHAVMLTSVPPLLYWTPGTLEVMHQVQAWRASGDPVFYTVDAGPNVHCIAPLNFQQELAARLRDLPSVQQVLQAPIGAGATLQLGQSSTSG